MAKKPVITDSKAKLLPRISLFFFRIPVITLVLWVLLVGFGIASYTTYMKRAGFPTVNIPVAIINGTYLVNNPAKVDADVAKPISDILLKDTRAHVVQAQSSDNFFTVAVQYNEGTDAHAAASKLKQQLAASHTLPPTAQVNYDVPYFGATGGDVRPIDVAVSFYSTTNTASSQELAQKAKQAATYLRNQHLTHVQEVFVKDPFQRVTDPLTGQAATVQKTFDRYGMRTDGASKFYSSAIIGVTGVKGVDAIKIDQQIRDELPKLLAQPEFTGYGAAVSASFAPSIKESISELQQVLLEGLLAVLVIGSIIIAWRASLITVVAMVTVLATTIGVLYLFGYTLNVITLFALILGLSLIVDDTIIMVEAIDAARRNSTSPREAVLAATRKISLAMFAATTTAALSFAPFLFVGSVLGDIIRPLPVTIITSLTVSLVVAIIFIPIFAKVLLLGKKQMGETGVREVAAGVEAAIARAISKPMRWAQNSRKKLFSVGITAVLIGFLFIGAGLVLSSHVVFNIFPPSKDTNGLTYTITFPPGTNVQQAEAITNKADQLASTVLGANLKDISYYGAASAQQATAYLNITPYTERQVSSPQLVKQLQSTFDNRFKGAEVAVSQLDVGPGASSFIVEVNAEKNRAGALQTAQAVVSFMKHKELVRPSGKAAHFENPTVASSDTISRSGGKQFIEVTAGFDGSDTTTLDTLAQKALDEEFTPSKLKSYGLQKGDVKVNLGQESENQNSFKTLVIALPILLLIIYLLLALQFRSLLQPFLIFMAIPFSIFGVMLGLFVTDNPISFFSVLGFFALIGLSIKNTILVTDYANQARRAGLRPVDAVIASLSERFRPLVATSLTAVVALIPLALTSPFWQALAVVLIFGLLSSTTLVILVFPYYYLGAEYLRMRVSRIGFLKWFVLNVAVAVLAAKFISGSMVVPILLLLNVGWVVLRIARSRKATA